MTKRRSQLPAPLRRSPTTAAMETQADDTDTDAPSSPSLSSASLSSTDPCPSGDGPSSPSRHVPSFSSHDDNNCVQDDDNNANDDEFEFEDTTSCSCCSSTSSFRRRRRRRRRQRSRTTTAIQTPQPASTPALIALHSLPASKSASSSSSTLAVDAALALLEHPPHTQPKQSYLDSHPTSHPETLLRQQQHTFSPPHRPPSPPISLPSPQFNLNTRSKRHMHQHHHSQRHMGQETQSHENRGLHPSSQPQMHSSLQRPPTPPKVTLLVNEPATKKWRNWWVRTFWTVIMITGFALILSAGHVWVIGLVGVIQALVYREVISIGIQPSKERRLPWLRWLHWYFLASTNYYLYGDTLIRYLKPVVYVDAFLTPLATHHHLISFTLYVLGLVNFVLNLKKGHYKFQFSHFCWTHMALLLVVVQSHFIINNIFSGLVWFVLPASFVICNDIMAYVFGFFFGRTPLIQLSPKKTWEGFLGGVVATMVFAFVFAPVVASSPYMVCPMENFRTSVRSGVSCSVNAVFEPREYPLSPMAAAAIRWLLVTPLSWIGPTATATVFGQSSRIALAVASQNLPDIQSLSFLPIQFHALAFAAFASLVAPFGGFFASGVKRAFKIKDFGDSIPGHGGLTDRMDCQFIMGVFVTMYYQSFIETRSVSAGSMLQTAVSFLSREQLIELHRMLGQHLIGQRVDL